MKKKSSKQLKFKIKDQSPRKKKDEIQFEGSKDQPRGDKKRSKKISKSKKSVSQSRNKRSSLVGFQNFINSSSDMNFNFTIDDEEEDDETPNITKDNTSFFSKSPTPFKNSHNDITPSFSVANNGQVDESEIRVIKKRVKTENEIFEKFQMGIDYDIDMTPEEARKINERPLEERPIQLSYFLFKKVREIVEAKVKEIDDKEDAERIRNEMMGYLDTRIRMLTERYTAEVEKEKQSMAEMSHNPENFKNMERMRIYERTHKMVKNYKRYYQNIIKRMEENSLGGIEDIKTGIERLRKITPIKHKQLGEELDSEVGRLTKVLKENKTHAYRYLKDLVKIRQKIGERQKELEEKKRKLKEAFTLDDFNDGKSDYEILSQFKKLHLK